ncbi:alpha/beta fold hydrolase [Actinomadura rudentiformis]|uniref:Alpha/beta fold hydrolase n=1 Tax=Actinomadura rudentiformis TaxID=359158 RepID=A0A6H9YJB7_9ACTN|nr:alpha/beta fold hydrolase [Actinomadura rudentiformis]KAB2339968.1 alpha/beta fold hydrolase [Actinomadura rudentiformis]
MKRLLGLLAAVALLFGMLPAASAAATSGAPNAKAEPRPMIFVHGFFGSGSQFQTQAKRFASNGYPATHIEFLEYDSTFANNTREQVHTALDQRIARLKAATGADKVDLLGHSLGTAISQEYLNSSAARAANVAHYVNIDGGTATSLPGGVPTMAIWGEGGQSRSITGATNVYQPNEAHVETTSSVATFRAVYRFFTGTDPQTTDVVPESGQIQLGGRAVLFPYNVGATNARLDVFTVNPATGRRTSSQPVATYQLSGDGSFGPFNGSGTAHYEFLISRTGSTQVQHLYFQPFRRTDLGIRLLTSEPGSLVDWLIERNQRHVALLAYRNKEWWGDQGAGGDTLTINGTSVLNATTTPRSKRAIGLFAYDWRSDRATNTSVSIGLFPALPFMSGVDIFMPSANPPNGTVTMETRQRGGNGQTARIVVPNWPSNSNTVTVFFDDYT